MIFQRLFLVKLHAVFFASMLSLYSLQIALPLRRSGERMGVKERRTLTVVFMLVFCGMFAHGNK